MPPRHLYVHVPFCTRRCSYCDFAIAVRRSVPVDDYVSGIDAELRLRGAGNPPLVLDTLYLGGGTPSRLGGEGITRLIDTITTRVSVAAGAEVTLETNPEDVSHDAARMWRAAGVTRISLGTQSFDDRVLAWMRRTHDAARAVAAVDMLRQAGFDNLSLDLIFALPADLGRSWQRDLHTALALAPTHLSLYGLTVEPQTPLGRWVSRATVIEAPEGVYESEFLAAHERLTATGFEHYEVSNFARPGYRSRHNWAYWVGAPYEGVGPAAHAYDGRRRRWNVDAYDAWRARLADGADPTDGTELLSEANRATERVYLGLRTANGLRLTDREANHVRPWVTANWATIDGDARLTLHPAGWLRLDALTQSLTALRSC